MPIGVVLTASCSTIEYRLLLDKKNVQITSSFSVFCVFANETRSFFKCFVSETYSFNI